MAEETLTEVASEALADIGMDLRLIQYRVYVETAEHVGDLRAGTQRFYIGVHTSLLTLLAIALGGSLLAGSGTPFLKLPFPAMIGIASLGFVLSTVWYLHIGSYRALNGAKFEVIHEMERGLPFKPFGREWGLLTGPNRTRNYVRLTTIERYVPILSALAYTGIAGGLVAFALGIPM